MKKQRFWYTKRQCYVDLPVARLPGMFMLRGKPWSTKALQALGLILDSRSISRSQPDDPLVFGDPTQFQGSFCRTQSKGSVPSWGYSGGFSGKVARAPKS